MPRTRLYDLTAARLAGRDRILVAGDIHGDAVSFHRLLDHLDPDRDVLVLLGDYADRGGQGVEVIEAVDALLDAHPGTVIALKGNHEDYSTAGAPRFSPCDLVREADAKRGGWTRYYARVVAPFLERLHLAVRVPGQLLFVHGGVSRRVTGPHNLAAPSRAVEEALLWSDPVEGIGEHPNPRGAGVTFGRDVSASVCRAVQVRRILRGHQPRSAHRGPAVNHDGRVVTLSATRVYGGTPFVVTLPTRSLLAACDDLAAHTLDLT
jgi:hypothetical protein